MPEQIETAFCRGDASPSRHRLAVSCNTRRPGPPARTWEGLRIRNSCQCIFDAVLFTDLAGGSGR